MSEYITFNTATALYQPPFKCSGYGLGAMVAKMDKPVVLEIGCDVGDTSEFLLNSNPNLLLTGVDPYSDYLDWNGNMLVNRENVCQNTLKRLEKYTDDNGYRFHLIRKTSDEAHSIVFDDYFDVVFIDGIHTYEQVLLDCENYYSKVKVGGVFAGHDYNVIPGVNRAVKEFAEKVGKEILTTECDVWYWIK